MKRSIGIRAGTEEFDGARVGTCCGEAMDIEAIRSGSFPKIYAGMIVMNYDLVKTSIDQSVI